MAKVKDILVVFLVRESKLDIEVPVPMPVGKRVKEARFVLVQTKVVFANGFRIRHVAVSSEIQVFHKVHGSGAGHVLGTGVAGGLRDTRLELVDLVVSAIWEVSKPHWVEIVRGVGLDKRVRFPNLHPDCRVLSFAFFKLIVTKFACEQVHFDGEDVVFGDTKVSFRKKATVGHCSSSRDGAVVYIKVTVVSQWIIRVGGEKIFHCLNLKVLSSNYGQHHAVENAILRLCSHIVTANDSCMDQCFCHVDCVLVVGDHLVHKESIRRPCHDICGLTREHMAIHGVDAF